MANEYKNNRWIVSICGNEVFACDNRTYAVRCIRQNRAVNQRIADRQKKRDPSFDKRAYMAQWNAQIDYCPDGV